jgi:hypothetical protein
MGPRPALRARFSRRPSASLSAPATGRPGSRRLPESVGGNTFANCIPQRRVLVARKDGHEVRLSRHECCPGLNPRFIVAVWEGDGQPPSI